MRRFAFGLLALCAVTAPPALAVQVNIAHQYGEPVDRGVFTAYVSTVDGTRLDCASGAQVVREGRRIVLLVKRVPGPPDYQVCPDVPATIGELPVGEYEVEARAQALDGASYDRQVVSLVVAPIEGRCNADPFLQPSLYLVDKSKSGTALVQRLANDPAFRAKLGNPNVVPDMYPGPGVWVSYPPLLDATYMAYYLDKTGELEWIGRNAWACGVPPPGRYATVVEYYHAGLDHYFYASDEDEIASIDAGRVGPWTRTGHSFRVLAQPGCRQNVPGTMVYRFAGIPGKGPNSHFFTRDRAECGKLHASGLWAIESLPFHADAPDAAGVCANGGVQVHRLWRPVGDSNHRFTTDALVVSDMKAKGWVHEGVAMCVLPVSP